MAGIEDVHEPGICSPSWLMKAEDAEAKVIGYAKLHDASPAFATDEFTGFAA